MASISSRLIAVFAAFLLSVLLPCFASAQLVHEVRPARSEEVRIGAEANASMRDVVRLARRLTGNTALDTDDVTANNVHVRYRCRIGGRYAYYGIDTDYGGRCPADAVRSVGVLRGAVYRIPRVHGDVLRSGLRSRSGRASEARIAELEQRLNDALTRIQAADATAQETRTVEDQRRIELLSASLENLRRENARLGRELEAARRGEITFSSRLSGMPVWGWLLCAAMVALAFGFILFAFFILPREKKPLCETIENLTDARDDLKCNLEGEQMAHKVVIEDLEPKVEDLERKVGELEAESARKEAVLKLTLPKIEELVKFQERRDRIATCHARLMELRETECLYDSYLLQIREAEFYLADDDGDESRSKDCRAIIAQCRDQIERLPFDPGDLKAEIAGLVASLKQDMELQCGLHFDGRSADEWKAEWDDRLRGETRKAEAAERTYRALVALVEQQGLNGLSEISEKRALLEHDLLEKERELENGFARKEGALQGRAYRTVLDRLEAEEQLHEDVTRLRVDLADKERFLSAMLGEPTESAKALMARDALIGELTKKLRDAGIDPGTDALVKAVWSEAAPPVQDNGAQRPPRRRAPTLAITASRDSQIPAPPSSPMNALNRDVYRFLDTIRSLPPETWTIDCNEEAGRDWAFLLHNCSISLPRIGTVPLRDYLPKIQAHEPTWLKERLRRPTDPPPVPSAA